MEAVWSAVATAGATVLVALIGWWATKGSRRDTRAAQALADKLQEQVNRRAEIDQVLEAQKAWLENQAGTISRLQARLRKQDEEHAAELAEERRRHAQQLREERERAAEAVEEFRAHREECSRDIAGLRRRVEQAEERAATLAALVTDEIAAAAALDVPDAVTPEQEQ